MIASRPTHNATRTLSPARATRRSGPAPVTGLADNEHVHDFEVEGTRMACDVGPEGLPDVLAAVQAAGAVALDCRPPSLEEIFLRHYGQDPRVAELILPNEAADPATDDTPAESAAPAGADEKVPS